MPRAQSNGIDLEYETFGRASDPALVLIMGHGAQLIDWPADFCEGLAAWGFFVVRFDNRDAGLSSRMDSLGTPDLAAVLAGRGTAPYLLADLAEDTVGLMDALGIDKANVVGASMGGMIAQQLAIDHPGRLLTLCCIMSTTGSRSVGQPSPEAVAVLGAPPAATRAEAIERNMRVSQLTGSPGFAASETELRERAARKYDRAYRPAGALRQLAAIIASPDRTGALHDVKVPTVVIHGEHDPLIHVSGGRATAAAIPDAELLIIPGLGHELAAVARPLMIEAIVRTASRA